VYSPLLSLGAFFLLHQVRGLQQIWLISLCVWGFWYDLIYLQEQLFIGINK
jgi:hypothetical protein